jgi:hypothetical protein
VKIVGAAERSTDERGCEGSGRDVRLHVERPATAQVSVDDLCAVGIVHPGRRDVVEVAVEHEAGRSFAEVADDVAHWVDRDVPVAEVDELRRKELGDLPLLPRKARGRSEPLGEGDEVAFERVHQPTTTRAMPASATRTPAVWTLESRSCRAR